MKVAAALLTLVLVCCISLVFTTEAKADAKSRIMRVAKSYNGVPYHQTNWNCSDFTSVVFRRATGVSMPDVDDRQRHYGRGVKKLKRGDLVLFKENRNHGPVTHVGIYAGRGMLWHSSNYFGETVKSEMQYIEGYKGARRIR